MSHATYTETRTIPLNELTPYPGNARRGNVNVILDSLRRNAQYRSLVVRQNDDNTLTVLAGNHTLQALQVHGAGPCDTNPETCGICHGQPWQPSARCELLTCDDNTAWRINLVDNRAPETGDYDTDALTELFAEHDDYDGTGYTEEDVQLLTAPPPTLDELADDYGDPQEDDFWPVLKIKISPDDRDTFYALTTNCHDTNDDAERFRHLLNRARSSPDPTP